MPVTIPMEIARLIKEKGINSYSTSGEGQDSKDTRGWGSYEVVGVGNLPLKEGGWPFCDKTITLNPGAKLSVQKHYFRREDWKVTDGVIVVSHGPVQERIQETIVSADGAIREIHLPENGIHFVENRSDREATFFERQFGPILDEDDNVRFPTQDSYAPDGRFIKGDVRTANFKEMAKIIAEFKKRKLNLILDGLWSNAYTKFDPTLSELRTPQIPLGHKPVKNALPNLKIV